MAIERFLEQERAIRVVLMADYKATHLLLGNEDLETLKSVIGALEPVCKMTDLLSGKLFWFSWYVMLGWFVIMVPIINYRPYNAIYNVIMQVVLMCSCCWCRAFVACLYKFCIFGVAHTWVRGATPIMQSLLRGYVVVALYLSTLNGG